jgi:hypothetical protein
MWRDAESARLTRWQALTVSLADYSLLVLDY